MTDAGFFKGTSADQDARFADKKKKLMKTMKFGENLAEKVDMTKINLKAIRPWIVKRITELLNFDDEVVCDYVFNQLEVRYPDPKEIQINITGFLNSKNARIFLTELWDLLLSAMDTPDGVPAAFLEAKKEEIVNRQAIEKQTEVVMVKHKSDPKHPALITRESAKLIASNNGNGFLLPAADVNAKRANSHSSSSSSPHRKKKSPKRSSRRRRSRSDSSKRHRRRHKRRHSSNRSDSKSRRHRSSSRGRKRPPSGSDWRKDLMAGRRRSPPEMPVESSEKNSHERHSKKHDKDKKSHSRQRSVSNEGRDKSSKNKKDRADRSRSRSITTDRTLESNRVVKDQEKPKKAQPVEAVVKQPDPVQKAPVIIEGPELPPVLNTKVPVKQKKRHRSSSKSSSSDNSSQGSSGSSDSESDSNSSQSSSSSSSSNASPVKPKKSRPARTITAAAKPNHCSIEVEGPALPPPPPPVVEPEGPMPPQTESCIIETEGPSLPPPPVTNKVAEWMRNHKPSDRIKESEKVKSSSSQSSSADESGTSDSDSSSSSGSSSDSEDKKHRRKHHKKRLSDTKRNSERLYEGPMLPDSTDRHRRAPIRESDSSEEVLRQRALASLKRVSEDKRS